MLDTAQDVVIIICTVVGSLILMGLLNRFWSRESRRVHNDLIGWQLSILGTTYAVIVGFMLYTVWTNFGVAESNADAEANAILNVYRLADGLPDPQRNELRQYARAYVDSVVYKEWPAMANGASDFKSSLPNHNMWQTLMTVKGASPTQNTAESHALTELDEMNQHRRMRLLQSASRLPSVLWCVLLIGGGVTLGSACMFGSGSTVLHGIQVSVFSLLISLVLVAIGDIDRPFQGTVHVSNSAFLHVEDVMKEY